MRRTSARSRHGPASGRSSGRRAVIPPLGTEPHRAGSSSSRRRELSIRRSRTTSSYVVISTRTNAPVADQFRAAGWTIRRSATTGCSQSRTARRQRRLLLDQWLFARAASPIWSSRSARAWSTWRVVCSTPNRSSSSRSSSRRIPWQSASGSTSTCAESAGKLVADLPDVQVVHLGHVRVARPSRGRSRRRRGRPGAISSRTRPEARSRPTAARTISAATSSAAIGSARS